MKKSLLALVILGAFAGAASAQSSVTIFGKIDQAALKRIGFNDKQIGDTAGSRIAFRGSEDLGSGMAAIFAFEHRFLPDTGTNGSGVQPTSASSSRFWEGFSFVGLRTPFGAMTLGRQYTSSFLTVQNQVDVFAGETIAALRDIGMGNSTVFAINGVGQVRVADSVKYAAAFSGVTLSADLAETPTGSPDRPYSVAASYGGGPFWVGASFENPAGAEDRLANLGARFTFGQVTLAAGLGNGKNNAAVKLKSFLLGANIAVGTGDIKVGYASLKLGSTDVNKRFGLGYHHNLSKRTKLYVDYAHDSKGFSGALPVVPQTAILRTEKKGYDLGIQHNF